MEKTDILKYCKYYHGEKENPYKDFEKMYLWQAERMSITDNENQKKSKMPALQITIKTLY